MLDLYADDIAHEKMKLFIAGEICRHDVTIVFGHVPSQVINAITIEIRRVAALEKQACGKNWCVGHPGGSSKRLGGLSATPSPLKISPWAACRRIGSERNHAILSKSLGQQPPMIELTLAQPLISQRTLE